MKKYIKPSMDIVKLENVSLLAASGNKVNENLNDNTRLFANFGAHNAQLQNSLRKFYIKC